MGRVATAGCSMAACSAAHDSRRRLLAAASVALLAVPAWPCLAARGKPPIARERAWVERSQALAQSAKANVGVADFRRDIVAHRERLRELVRARPDAPPAVVQLQRSMILINALLNAASECHSGGRIVCPADLLERIDHQLRVTVEHLRAAEGVAS